MKTKITKWILVFTMLILVALTGCSKNNDGESVKTKTFTSKNERYSITIPDIKGGWTVAETNNDDHLVIDNPDRSFTILVQAYPLSTAIYTCPDFDSFVTYYQEMVLGSLGDPTPEELSLDWAVNAKAEFYSVTYNNVVSKNYIAYIETENAYYTYVLTGLSEQYDENIDAQIEAISTLEEH